MLTIAASLSGKSPFQRPLDQRDEARQIQQKHFQSPYNSDHLSLCQAYNEWRSVHEKSRHQADNSFCSERFLSRFTLWEIHRTRKQLAQLVSDLGFDMRTDEACRHDNDPEVCSAVIAASLYPHLVRVDPPRQKYMKAEQGALPIVPEAQQLSHRLADNSRVFIHPSSFLFHTPVFDSGWYVYSELVHTSKPLVRDISMVSPYAILLLCGANITVKYSDQLLIVDDWIEFQAKPQLGFVIKQLRSHLDHLLAQKFSLPNLPLSSSPLVHTIIRLLQFHGFS